MTPGSDAEPTAPTDPSEDRPRAMLGVGFWATVALCILCVLAGVGVAVLAPRLSAHRPAARVEAPPRAAASQPRPQALGERAQSR